MSFPVELWPFDPQEPEECARWWRECYLPGIVDGAWLTQTSWSMLIGPTACGKSTALALARRIYANKALVIDYPPASWPTQADPPEKNHLVCIMRLVAEQVRERISANPQLVAELTESQSEFLRWLLDKFIGPRAFIRLLDRFPKELDPLARPLREIVYTDLYSSQSAGDVEGQIEELISFVNRLSIQQVLILIDAGEILNLPQLAQMETLVQWLELKHHLGFRGIIGMPKMGPSVDHWREMARGRIKIFQLNPTEEQCMAIVNRFLVVATAGRIQGIQNVLGETQAMVVKDLIQAEYGAQVPGAWLKFLRLVLESASVPGQPLEQKGFTELLRKHCSQHLKLYVDPAASPQGAWRGSRFIALDPGPFSLVREMVRRSGKAVDFADLGHKKENMHTLVHRVREKIEPDLFREVDQEKEKTPEPNDSAQAKDPAQPVYLHNRKGYGYWLENFVDLSGS
jgi:hypothetical protein